MATVKQVPVPNQFDKLPIETCQNIALYLPSAKDIHAFLWTCRSTYAAIEQDHHSFWRAKFMQDFDFPDSIAAKPGHATNHKLRDEYLQRLCLISNEKAWIYDGVKMGERIQLRLLKDMIVQSFSTRTGVAKTSKNLAHIIEFVKTGCIAIPFARGPGRYIEPDHNLLLVQCLIAPTILTHAITTELGTNINSGFAMEKTTEAVFGTDATAPFFIGHCGNIVDVKLVVKHLNFWKSYLNQDPASWLMPHFQDLTSCQKPRYPTSKLSNIEWTLGKEWRGCYSFFEDENDLERLRHGRYNEVSHEITFGGEGQDGPYWPFQRVEFSVLTNDELQARGPKWWPEQFEEHLDSLKPSSYSPKTRAQRKAHAAYEHDIPLPNHAVEGMGTDLTEDFTVKGWLNTLPSQDGVPGWQRVTLMKYYIDDNGFLDEDALWAYEGVVLSGGKIMLGRWWRADGDPLYYSGPFLLWCIDDE